jgi:hypothetical protein
VGVGAATGAVGAAIYGGNVLQSAIIGAVGAAIGQGFGQWANAAGGIGTKGIISVMSGGTVGGLSNVAMGGDFWEGFAQGGITAGLSFAANAVAEEIKAQALSGRKVSTGLGDPGSSQLGPDGARWPAQHETQGQPVNQHTEPLPDTHLDADLTDLGNRVEQQGVEIYEVGCVDDSGNRVPSVTNTDNSPTRVNPPQRLPRGSHPTSQSHGHLQEGTPVSGDHVSMGASWGDTYSALNQAERYEKIGQSPPPTYVTQRDAAGVRYHFQFH